MWAECNWCCAGFLLLWQPETKAWTCTKSTALVKAPAALSGMLSDNPEPATITVSPYREKCELKRSQSPLAENESLQGREGKGKKEAGVGVWRTSPSPFLPDSLGSLSVEGVSCMVIPGHWRGPRAKKYYSVGALLLSFLLLPISLTAAGHGCTSKVRTKTDIYRITCRKGSEDDLEVHLGTRLRALPILSCSEQICWVQTKILRKSWSHLGTLGRVKDRANKETQRRVLHCHFFHLFSFHMWQVVRKEMKSGGRSHWWDLKHLCVSPSWHHMLSQERCKERKLKEQEVLWAICRNWRKVGKGDMITLMFGKILCFDSSRKTFKQRIREDDSLGNACCSEGFWIAGYMGERLNNKRAVVWSFGWLLSDALKPEVAGGVSQLTLGMKVQNMSNCRKINVLNVWWEREESDLPRGYQSDSRWKWLGDTRQV